MSAAKEEAVDLDAIEARAKSATPGPWRAGTYEFDADAYWQEP